VSESVPTWWWKGEKVATVVASCPECGAATDIEYGDKAADIDALGNEQSHECEQGKEADRNVDTIRLSLAEQLAIYGQNAELVLDQLLDDLSDPKRRATIIALGAKRLVDGYWSYGDEMFHVEPWERRRESDEELADYVAYGVSGPME
jgi:hypothetical protein